MNLVRPSFEILYITNSLDIIEEAGRTCYKSKCSTVEERNKFILTRIKGGHESVIEHSIITVKFICDRGVTHELVRHRLCAFSQESTRYCNYSGGVTFIIPLWLSQWIEPGEYPTTDDARPNNKGARHWFADMLSTEWTYKVLLDEGWSPQQARTVLPNSLKTEIIVTANFREWRHILKLRTAKAAHPQMREIMRPLLSKLKETVPVIFDDINYKEEEV